ncbi:MAG: hypothetical protein VB084_08350 [Syntrophomonadaceae bacterium]|nr:hypothetical protein [Syntrophomonadaceae bacterium]
MAAALVLGIGLMGPAWATWWDHSLTLKATTTTGHMTRDGDVVFSSVYDSSGRGNGDIDSGITAWAGNNDHKLHIAIDQVKEPGAWEIEYTILNQEATIPVRLITDRPDLPLISSDAGLSVSDEPAAGNDGFDGVLDPGQSWDRRLLIAVDAEEPGIYNFSVTIPCRQFNKIYEDTGGWTDTLEISGYVQVEADDPIEPATAP